MLQHSLHWFEIIVTDFDRSTKFYETLFGQAFQRHDIFGGKMAVFPGGPAEDKNVVRGAIWYDGKSKPSADGTCVYLNAEGHLQEMLDRAVAAGGTVFMPVTSIGPSGFIALFGDTEGNKVGLHSST